MSAETVFSWILFCMTVYVSLYLALIHSKQEPLFLALGITHLGNYISFRKYINWKRFMAASISHLAFIWWFGANALEVLSTLDEWKQGF
ncbi:hypothetical protein CH373_01705 [Leptospira perolatii]|uniref:Uncharacterized protein n=1 Tax=Leptospira perolatii TaxID=2023191 RepID=A0A2M9ZS82_9LEPT|nr:hypothetical protein [Leptospira perolatii]PJZ71250.1 hypothetical protein CH360_01705 [Leptospira perolatii]PJZ74783.1 hypothetical protein CH373_01705 [Leptospira perolatii]